MSGFTQKLAPLATFKNVPELGNRLPQAVRKVTAHICHACDRLRPWSCTMAEPTGHLALLTQLQGVCWVMIRIA